MINVFAHQHGACLAMLLSALVLAFPACGATEEVRPTEAAEPEAPPGLEVPAPGQVFRFIDPGDGSVQTASSLEGVPEAARNEVLVFDASAPTPAGWEHVADLSGVLPTQSTPTRGFVLRPSVSVVAAPATTRAKRAAHEVVMFSTQGCGFCKKASAFFKKHGVAHSEYDIERDAKAGPKLQELAKAAGVPLAQLQGGVPLIFIDGSPHVGFDRPKLAKLLGI